MAAPRSAPARHRRLAQQDASFAAGAGEFPGVEGAGGGVPVDGGHGGAAACAALDEPAGEVVAMEERSVGDEECDVGPGRLAAGGAGHQGGDEVVSVHVRSLVGRACRVRCRLIADSGWGSTPRPALGSGANRGCATGRLTPRQGQLSHRGTGRGELIWRPDDPKIQEKRWIQPSPDSLTNLEVPEPGAPRPITRKLAGGQSAGPGRAARCRAARRPLRPPRPVALDRPRPCFAPRYPPATHSPPAPQGPPAPQCPLSRCTLSTHHALPPHYREDIFYHVRI